MICMNEEKKKKRLRGFANIVFKQFEHLNENEKFKEKYRDTELKLLLNAKNGKYAALLVIDKGTIQVEGIKNQPKENLKKKKVGWDGLIQTTLEMFLELLKTENISIGMITRKVLRRKIKIRGIKKTLVLLQLLKL